MSLSEIKVLVMKFIEEGSLKETTIYDLSFGNVQGVIEVHRHVFNRKFTITLKKKISSPRTRRYLIKNGKFDFFGLGLLCDKPSDVTSIQIVFNDYKEAFDYCCEICSIFKQDKRLLNPRDSNFFLPAIPNKLLEILDGTIAGDGGVYVSYKSGMFKYSVGHNYFDHIEELRKCLAEFGYSGNIRTYLHREQTDKHGKDYFTHNLTWSLEAFNDLRYRWYLGKQKIIPKDLKNSPNFWRWFYAGDGCLFIMSPFSYRILISANDFLTEDVDRLISMLGELEINAVRYLKRKTKSTGEPQWIITINSHRDVDKFLDYIGKPVKSLEYKWLRPKKHIRVCQNNLCKKNFTPTRGDNIYCSIACIRDVINRKQLAKRKK